MEIQLEAHDNMVECPRQGDIHVEYCMGCPRRLDVTGDKHRTIVICDPGDVQSGPLWEPLRSPPAPFRLYDD